MCVHGRTVPSSLGPCLEPPCLPVPPPGPGGQAPVHQLIFHIDLSAPCLSPGFMWKISAWTPLCLSKCSAGEGTHKCPRTPADPGRRAAQAVLALRESPVSLHHQPCSPRAGVGCGGQHPPAVYCWAWRVGQGWGQDGGCSPGVECRSRKWAVQRQIPHGPLQWWPEGRIEEPPPWCLYEDRQADDGWHPQLQPTWAAFAGPGPQVLFLASVKI